MINSQIKYLLSMIIIFPVFCTFAYTITVDGNLSDWLLPAPTTQNLGHIQRDSSGRGEYIYLDASNDERTDFFNPDPQVDLVLLRITGDSNNIYFGFQFTDITTETGDGAVQIQIAVDTDRVFQSGQSWFGALSDTQVSPFVYWERLIMTRFGSGNMEPIIYDTSFNPVGSGFATSSVSATNDVIEIAVPWRDLNLTQINGPIAFTIAIFRANSRDETWDISNSSDVLDAVTNYFDPGSTSNTWTEVQDGVVNYNFELWFNIDPDREPHSPLLISECLYDPPGTESQEEWIEIYNVTSTAISLISYKIGDEETPDGSEGMYIIETIPPNITDINPQSVKVIALNATGFYNLYGYYPDYEINDSTPSVPDCTAYTNWATGTLGLRNLGDEILLVDPYDTVIDVLTYGNSNYPGVTPHPGTSQNVSLERYPISQDTNNCSVDFRTQSSPNPGFTPTTSTPTPANTPTPAPTPVVPIFTNLGLLILIVLVSILITGKNKIFIN